LQQAGAEFGIINVGYRASDSLRLEKRHLTWGIDVSPDDNPCEAGLQFLIDWDKGGFALRHAHCSDDQRQSCQWNRLTI